jgi:hypothetical protein
MFLYKRFPLSCRAGKIHVKNSLHLTSYLRKEKSYYPWKAFFNSIDILAEEYLHTSANYGIFRVNILVRAGEVEISNESYNTPFDLPDI